MSTEATKLRLGGMALRNGLLVHGPTSWAAAARDRDGLIQIAGGRKPSFSGRLGGVPLARGPLRLAEGMAIIPLARLKLPAARLPIEEPRFLAGAAGALAVTGLARRLRLPAPVVETISATVALAPTMLAMRGSEIAAYHAVEHKSIGAYETGGRPAETPKEHERCGSNLVGPLAFFSIAGQAILERLVERPGRIAQGLTALGATGAAVEVFALAERRPNSPIGRGVHRAGHEIQARFVTTEPTAEQMEVGEAALAELLRIEDEV